MTQDVEQDQGLMWPPGGAGRRRRLRPAPGGSSGEDADRVVPVDPYRGVVFPNRIREQRLSHGHAKLLAFATLLPDIPYVRLSKIERGEVFARADELARIADAIGMDAQALLIDVDRSDFDIATWFAPFTDAVTMDSASESRASVLLAAAVRRRRALEPELGAAAMDERFGIAPVILSRIENAYKGISRWNMDILAALCRLFDVPDEAALRRHLESLLKAGELDGYVDAIADPEVRRRRTGQRMATLAVELRRTTVAPRPVAPAALVPDQATTTRRVPVHGVPAEAPGGILLTPGDGSVEAPGSAGPRAFAVRMDRASLGPGLPARTTLVVDPDIYPRAGGLALVRDGDVHRIIAVLVGRDGGLIGYSVQPEFEIAIDALSPADVASVIAAHFV